MGQVLIPKNNENAVRVSGNYRGVFPFVPKRAYFEKNALEYPLGRKIYGILKELGVEVMFAGSHNRITGIPGSSPRESYLEGKRTMVIGVRKTLDFQTCKPSAHFQLPLVTSCPGMCEYCYLNTTLGKKPYIRIYVNIDEILGQAVKYIKDRMPEDTIFEGAATSDPLPVEPYTNALARTIDFFGKQEHGFFRFVTKFSNVDSLLKLNHGGHTRFRFSLNAGSVIDKYERGTPRLAQRVDASLKVHKAGYPAGFIIAPIIKFEGWKEEYRNLFSLIHDRFGMAEDLSLELITHRFTKRAKANILDIFPESTLPMEESERKFKYGQFGYGKYIYNTEDMGEIKSFFEELVEQYTPSANSEYFI